MRSSLTSLVVALSFAGCSSGGGRPAAPAPAPAPYVECSEASPCAASDACVFGLCLPRCGAGPACVEREVCQDDGTCGEPCDERHPCTQAYSCVEGSCKDDPCGHPEHWPLALESASIPAIVHYRDRAEAETAAEALRLLEISWRIETEDLGFEPPLPDGGRCGPDDRFDVFIWRSYRAGTGDVIAPNPDTEWDDDFAYLIIDPWGPYGGEILDGTIAHELNHGMHAVHDWNETPVFFEMSAQFVEDQVFDDDNNYITLLADFQQRPDWAFDYDDHYDTWYFYGAALYLFYLRDAVFDGDPRFLSELWRRSRNPPGDNEPDFEDALDSLLGERAGLTFLDTLVTFTRWRYFTGRRDDGRHFEEGRTYPEEAEVRIDRALRVGEPAARFEPGPMMLGASFVTVARGEGGPEAARVAFEGAPGVRWSVQAVPGLTPESDHDDLDLSSGSSTLHFGDLGERTLVLLTLPPDAASADPESRTDARYPFTLTVTAE